MTNTMTMRSALRRDLQSMAPTRERMRTRMQSAGSDVWSDWDRAEQLWQRAEHAVEHVGDDTRHPINVCGDAARALLIELGRRHTLIEARLARTHAVTPHERKAS